MAWSLVTSGATQSGGTFPTDYFPINNNNSNAVNAGDLIIVSTYCARTVANVSDPSNGSYTKIAEPTIGLTTWYFANSQPFAINSLKITVTFGGGLTAQGTVIASVWRGGAGSLNHVATGTGTGTLPNAPLTVDCQNDTAGNLLYMYGGFGFNGTPTPLATGLGDCSFGSTSTTSSADTGNLGFFWTYFDRGETDSNTGLRTLGATITNTSSGSITWWQISAFFNVNPLTFPATTAGVAARIQRNRNRTPLRYQRSRANMVRLPDVTMKGQAVTVTNLKTNLILSEKPVTSLVPTDTALYNLTLLDELCR